MTTIINLFAGPGAGKSTIAAGVFYLLKTSGINCEYVPEEAKDFTWEERQLTLGCTPYIFAKQMRNLWRLLGKVDIVVTDSPILLAHVYADGSWPQSFLDCVVDIFGDFDNLNVYLRRKNQYNLVGRNQTENESRKIDEKICRLFVDKRISCVTMDVDSDAPAKIVKLSEEFLLNKRKKTLTKSRKGV